LYHYTEVDPKEEAEKAARLKLAPLISTRAKVDWAPEPLLCKRFGVKDPYEHRPRPDNARAHRLGTKADSLQLTETMAAATAAAPKFLLAGGGGRVGTFHHVILQSKHQLMTASMFHVTDLTPWE
jgi:hypothetical protein